MKLLLLILFLSAPVGAIDWEMDVSTVDIEYAWRGDRNYAQFTETLYGVGVTAWWDSIGIRGGYLEGKPMNTEGRFESITVNMEYILSIELLYRYELTDSIFVYAGVATHWIPVPMHWEGIDPDSHAANDRDDDEGYIFGIQIDLNQYVSVGYRFTHYSRIKEELSDEWIKGYSLSISYVF